MYLVNLVAYLLNHGYVQCTCKALYIRFFAFHRIGENDENLNHPYLRQYFFFLAIFKLSIENNTGYNF